MHWSLEWQASDCSPNKGGKKHFKRTKWIKIIVQRSKARGLYREITESREKEEKRKSENSKEICEALKSDDFLLKHYTYFWSTELHLESTREGQVEEGVRVALLKLDTDGSRPMGEMSESCKDKTQAETLRTGLQLISLLAENAFQQGRPRQQKGFFISCSPTQ